MQHLQPNTTLQGGKYRIERVLGQGGFGITYLATQTSLQRKVAIKEFFMKEFCSRDEATLTMLTSSVGSSKQVEQYRKKFIKEARNLARLNHPNIISVIDVFEENGTVYYAMPYLIGGSLLDYVKVHGTLSETMAMKYVRQIAGALKYMHEEEHICHYDVKPANILIDDKDNAVLIDFGISKNYDSAGHETTTTPVGMSEGYAPIEQYQQNVEEFSPTSDVYALGATLYFLLHGKRPVSAVHPLAQVLKPPHRKWFFPELHGSENRPCNTVPCGRRQARLPPAFSYGRIRWRASGSAAPQAAPCTFLPGSGTAGSASVTYRRGI